MRKILIITMICLTSAGFARLPEHTEGRVSMEDIVLSLENDRVLISFRLVTDRWSVCDQYSAVITPVLSSGVNRLELPGITVRSKKAAKYQKRRELKRNYDKNVEEAAIITGESFDYRTSVVYEPWMAGSDMKLDIITEGCGATAGPLVELVAENLLIGDTVRIVNVIEPPVKPVRKTVADIQAEKFSFVAPLIQFEQARKEIVEGEDFDEEMLLHLGKALGTHKQVHVEKFVERHRPGSLVVYFTQGKRIIDETYRDNARSLTQLLEAVEAIESSGESHVERVVIAGFASPEGSTHHNDQLAWNRAQAVKEYLLDNTRLAEGKIRIYNGSEDWLGLRRMVEASDMQDKEQVLEIIDYYPREYGGQGYGKLWRLRNLNGGRTYRYMYENYFPELRNAAYIKVYYENDETKQQLLK